MPRPDPPAAPITVVALPPERGRARSLAPAQAGASCCCCCCCCLHSVGAVIGAAVAPAFGQQRRRGPRDQEEADYGDFAGPVTGDSSGRMSAVGLFWLSNLILAGLVVVGCGAYAAVDGAGNNAGSNFPLGMLAGGFGIVMLLPVHLLIAALVTLVILAVQNRPDKTYQFGRLGRITLGLVIGTLAGGVPMAAVIAVLIYK